MSWYSLSSPHEWFAEQYAHDYRHDKHGDGLDPGTKTKLDELDTQQPSDHELMKPGDGGDAETEAAGAGGGRGRPDRAAPAVPVVTVLRFLGLAGALVLVAACGTRAAAPGGRDPWARARGIAEGYLRARYGEPPAWAIEKQIGGVPFLFRVHSTGRA